MHDPYLYDDIEVLKNKLHVKDEQLLDKIESESSKTNMALLYVNGFKDFSPTGICKLHKLIFSDIYEWAGKYRVINIIKREEILAGQSVWYSNVDDIENDLKSAFKELNSLDWGNFTKEQFIKNLTLTFSKIWQIHPFREGNTRAIVTMLTFFVESFGYKLNKELLAECAGYVRNSFVLASLGKYSEHKHLEKILMDAISNEYGLDIIAPSKKEKYQKEHYIPNHHTLRDEKYEKPNKYDISNK